MFEFIDNFLNKTTMYRLVLYCLVFLVFAAAVFSYFGKLPFSAQNLLFSAFFFLFFCLFTNAIFAKVFQAPSNIESVYITALILVFIVSPIQNLNDLIFIFFISALAMASKYILAIRKKHIFNPAAVAVAITGLVIGQAASWWVGNVYMMPFVLLIGVLITRKIKKTDLVISFFAASSVMIIGKSIFTGQNPLNSIQFILFYSFVLFMGFVMFTEPMTTPPSKTLRIIYGGLVGFLSAPFVHIGSFYFTPEIALLAGNIFSYAVSPKQKLILKLEEKIQIANDTYDFVFLPDRRLRFKAGQYLEWTLAHEKRDNRGMRRYFTIASSPTEKGITMGVKFYENPSSYKKALLNMEIGDTIIASQLAGDFVLPRDKNKKLIFIAGGIGITPFRSMIKYLIEMGEKRDIIIFYSNKSLTDIAYKQTFKEAQALLGIKTVYCLTDLNSIPSDWRGEKGFVDKKMIEKWAPDFKERVFYVSGPRSMVTSFQNNLKVAGIPNYNIITDYFPGFA